ncbi:hypothetical protein [Tsukamurella sp. USMM236]|uniref:hypothetical protein n=1 Tax=Tsukamurella sp. USMM236 TaxID=3081301 RepID=UPI0030167AE5
MTEQMNTPPNDDATKPNEGSDSNHEPRPTPAPMEVESSAPEWHEEFGEWGHWVDDPEDDTQEIWVPLEAKDDVAADDAPRAEVVQANDAEDHRKPEPKEGDSADLAWADGREPKRRCTARRTNGQPCRKAASAGMQVCRNHGGSAPQVKAKARVRLEMAADRMAKELLGIATNDKVPAYVKLEGIKTALDRAGIGAKQAVEVEVGPAKAWEQVFAGIAGGTREDSRAMRGGEPDEADPFAAHRAMMEEDEARRPRGYIDAEVVEPAEPSDPPAKLPPALASADAADAETAAEFVRTANAKAARTTPRHK